MHPAADDNEDDEKQQQQQQQQHEEGSEGSEDEELVKRKLMAEINHGIPMPQAQNIGNFGCVDLVNGIDLEERKLSSDATGASGSSANFAFNVDHIEQVRGLPVNFCGFQSSCGPVFNRHMENMPLLFWRFQK